MRAQSSENKYETYIVLKSYYNFLNKLTRTLVEKNTNNNTIKILLSRKKVHGPYLINTINLLTTKQFSFF